MVVRYSFSLMGIAAASILFSLVPLGQSSAQDVRHLCSEKYQAAKAAGTLNGETWPQFYSKCTAHAKANPPAAAATAPAPVVEAPAPPPVVAAPAVTPPPVNPLKNQPVTHHYGNKKGAPERPSILESGYDFLYAKTTEADGYGLYSYVILPSVSDRAAAFLDEVFKSFPAAGGLRISRIRTNILYIPTKEDSRDKFNLTADASREAVRKFLSSYYDLTMARLLLDHLCDQPAEEVSQLCQNDLSGGPYILTYASKISDLSPLPPPFLFVDLTNVHQHAFGQFVSAYRSQAKRPKFSNRAKIDTFGLTLLNLTLTAADWVQPISAAVAGIIHQANPKEKPDAGKC